MFQKILVPLDHSSMSQDLFEKALTLAVALKAELMLLHILSGEEPDSPLPIPPGADKIYWVPGSEVNLELWKKQWEQYAAKSLQILQDFLSQAQRQGVPTEVQQMPGNAGRAICDMATNWGADLIVIGNRGHTGLKELFLGSVSNYVLHHAPCSVLTVKFSAPVNA
ncbi:MAG: universal stress protein [Leptolyngbyaceae cyanobacterium]